MGFMSGCHGGSSMILRPARGGRGLRAGALVVAVWSTCALSLAAEEAANTPLMDAAYRGDVVVMRDLIARGADVDQRNAAGTTALIFAAGATPVVDQRYRGSAEAVELLVASGAAVDGGSASGPTPLMYAAMHGNVRSAEVLLQHGADVNAQRSFHETALGCAVSYGHDEMVLLLLDHGANPNAAADVNDDPLLLDAVNALGLPALRRPDAFWKRWLGFPGDIVQLEQRRRIVGMLLDRGADVNAHAPKGHTVLALAALSDDAPFVRELLARGADPNLRDAMLASASPLILAANSSGWVMVDALLERGADPRARDDLGRTALSIARKRRDDVMVQRLQRAGATE
jgi:ankyrin repeat protein